MKEIKNIIKSLSSKNIQILLDDSGENLRVIGDTSSLTEQDKVHISENKGELIKLLKVSENSNKKDFQLIEPIPESDNYAVSAGQNRLWTLSQFEGGSEVYNMPFQVDLHGVYDVACFSRAIEATLNRHEILRTVFKLNESGEVRQHICSSESLGFEIDYKDFRSFDDKESRVASYIKNDTYQPFDLSDGPLFRASLLQLSNDHYVFYYNMHHIICDGWSIDVLSKNVLSFYESFEKGEAPKLSNLPIQYKDYAAWQLSQLEEASSDIDKTYWLDTLSGELPVLDLPTSSLRPSIKTNNGHTLRMYVSKDTTTSLKAFCSEQKGSLFMGLLSVCNILFHKYTSDQDIIIGTPVAGRDHPDLVDQIGFYINTLALRNHLDPEENFISVYDNVKETTLASYSHQMYPFDRLVEDLDFKRDIGRSAIFDMMLALQNAGSGVSDFEVSEDDINAIIDLGESLSKFDLEFNFSELGGYLSLQVSYNTDVYDREMIEGLMMHFQQLLDNLLSSPETSINSIQYLTQEEEHQLLYDFNDTVAPYPNNSSLIDLFDEQVTKSPDALAVVFGDEKLTYKDLDELSNQFSQYLIENHDIRFNDAVGLQLDRSEWFVICILGILKLGAIYVPLDSEFPKDRINFIVSDSGCKTTICESMLDSFKGTIDGYDVRYEVEKSIVHPAAYMMYTSGSTGKPKGVVIEQKAIISLVKNTNYIALNEDDTILGLSNFSFDGSTFDIFMPLLNGASLVISTKDVFLDLEKLDACIKEQEISSFFLTTVFFNTLVESRLESLKELKYVLFGGEQVSLKHVKKFKELYPSVHLHHVYGPTENTTFSTYYEIKEVADNQKTIPIGSPISNSTCYILDSNEKLVPIGVSGEIYLGGDGLSTGYLNRPDLTDSAFITLPFTEGKLLYKTGDLGRWLPSGDVEFIGRKDDQVKIRGHRIEVGEVENALLKLEKIDDAVIVVRKNASDEKELIAYVISSEPQNASDLRMQLKGILSDYMIPSYYVQLEEFPVTTNGKVHKGQLPNPDDFGLSGALDYIAPRNETEEKLVGIWQNILDKTRVGIKDDFFELGGHSLKATRLINQYHEFFEIKLSLKDIFTNTTLESHATLITDSKLVDYQEICHVEKAENYLLSAGQERLWTLSQFEGGSSVYNMPFQVVLTGAYDITCLERAILATIDRHEILRTVFKINETSEIRQYVLPVESLGFVVDYKDFRDYEDKESRAKSYIEEDSYQPFDLENGPLLRASILQVSDDTFIFYYNMHHIISDGWSMDILSKDVLSFYESFKKGEEANLADLRIQYKDYAAWQLAQLENPQTDVSKNYWMDMLSGDLPVLDLPTSKLRPSVKTHNGHNFRTYLSPSSTLGLKDFSQEQGGSLFMSLLSVCNVLFHKYTSDTDFIIGTPIAGRDHSDLMDQIGFYVNTLALRNHIDSEDNFVSLHNRVKDNFLSSYSHQMYPFDYLVKDLELNRDTGRSAIFDVMLALQNVKENVLDLEISEDHIGSIIDVGSRLSKFDLELNFTEIGECLCLDVTYNTSVYDGEMIQGMMIHFQQLLNSLLSTPEEMISTIKYLSEEEENKLIYDFNNTDFEYNKASIVDVFVAQAAKTPENVAIVFENKKMTYRELDEISNRLAHYLIQHYQLQVEDLVGVKLDRSEWLIISLLAVLKAGAVYVPIDPNYPAQRIAYIEDDSKCKLTLDEDTLRSFRSVDISSNDLPEIDLAINSLAYVIYTSGSTGKPKGVMIEHRGIVNTIFAQRVDFKVEEQDNCLQFANQSFDASIWEILMSLFNGASLVIAKEEVKSDIALFEKFIRDHEVTWATLPPAYLRSLKINTIQSLKTLISAGEEAPLNKVLEFSKKGNYINAYGPTETSICATTFTGEITANVPIGKPIGNTRIYIVSENLELQPVGIVGELCVSGTGLARGYLNREELTQEKFIKNPFENEGRMYRTGDLARWLPNGNIEFIGRKDTQIKIRGHRIELGEIEKACLTHEEVDQCVVIVKKHNGENVTICYLVGSEKLNNQKLRSALSKELPNYMVPTFYVHLDSLPLTPNGKIDKDAFPEVTAKHMIQQEYVAPTNDIEMHLVAIWENLLNIEKVGTADNFFELGGHSLLAIRVLSELKDRLAVKISVTNLFNYPTISELASFIAIQDTASEVSTLIKREELPADIPLSYAQERLWFIDKLKGSEHYHMPVLLKLKGQLDITYLTDSLRTIIDRHEVLRTVYIEKQGVPYQQVLPIDDWQLSFLETATDFDDHIAKSINERFDLECDYMLRAKVLKVSEDEHILVLVRHHIASDGWSSSLLINEFMELYRSYTEERVPVLPDLALQYVDYSLWQQEYLTGDALSEKLDYWESKLSGVAPLEMPTDYPRPRIQSTKGESIHFQLDIEKSEKLKLIAQQEGVTLFMFLLSIYKVLLYRYSGQSDICVGTTVANRPQKELESLIGLFVNTLALRTDVSGDPEFRDVLQSVKQTTLEAYEHISVPFEKVVDRVETNRDKSRSSIFQVLFVLNNNPEAKDQEFDGITIASMDSEYVISKFDLTIFAKDSPEGLFFSFNYCSDLFTSDTISRLQDHYECLLDAVLDNVCQPIGNLSMLGASETEALVNQYNKLPYTITSNTTVLELFESQVSKTPDAIAFVYNNSQMTYRELDEASTQLAYYYQQTYGLERNDLMGIMMDTSNWSLLGVLSILKSGAGYVPIDPSLPKERQLYMVEEANVKCLIIESSSLFDVIDFAVPVFSIDIQFDDIESIPEAVTFSSLASPDTTAYVVYTSGTTGQPKGVQVSHKNLVDYYEGLEAKVSISENKSFGLMSSLAADLGNTVLYGSLLSGGCLHLFSKDTLMDGMRLQSYFRENRIDCIKIVPSHWQALRIEDELLLPSKTLVFGGDVLPVSYIKDIVAQDAGVSIINHYGPTESTIGKLLHQVDPDFDYVTIPVGELFSDSEAYIVSTNMSLCPLGVSGELLLGGSGISKGYLNRPDLTKEKFIDNPFEGGKSSVLYKTGDLVRRNALGQIEFLGRVDDQVKIRGYRVELKEISRVIQNYSGVIQSEVLFKEDNLGVKRLVSYLVTEESYSESDLKSYILGHLPDYMVPQVYVELEAMPLTSNGKIDRKALPEPTVTEERVYVAPSNEIEEELVTIWQDLLSVEKVGVTDDFFELGGHSLLAVRLLSVIKSALNVAITITDIFDYTTISGLASFIADKDTNTTLPLITKQELPADIPLSYAQERLWFIDKLKGSEHYHMPTLLNLEGSLNVEYLSKAFKTIVDRHETLRTVYVEKEGIAYQKIQPSDQWELNIVSTTGAYEDIVSEVVNKPFDLSKDYMLRATIIKISDIEHILVLVRHHIATDGWSASLIVNEFKELYASYESGVEATLPVLDFQYTDYAVWQRSQVSGDVLSEKLDYWESKLGGVTPSALPTDYLRPAVQSSQGDRVNFRLDKDRSEQLRSYAKQEGVTLFMLLLSVYKVLLYRYSGQSDICVGTTVANRPQQELESMIGFFVNTLALRTDLSENPSFNDVLQSVKKTTLEAYDHISVPFEKVVDRVEKTRDKSRSSLFQVLFVLNNNPDSKAAAFSDISISAMPMEYDIAKFDLTIFAEDSPEGFFFSFNYCSDLFSSAMMSRFRSHYENLLDAILSEGTSSIGSLNMLTQEEEKALVLDYNRLEYTLSDEGTVLSLFESQVSKTPDAVAFVYNDSSMTYRELDEASTRLAYYYQQTYGLERNDLIGIMMDTSNWSLLGILSILKSGAGYVPIDPSLPKERQSYMLQEASVKCLLIESSSLFDVIDFSVPVFSIDIQSDDVASIPEGESLEVLSSPDTTAYVVYTSGTTGQPKGVQVSHKNLVDYYEGLEAKITISDNKSFGLMSSLSADLGNTVLYGSLLSGGCLHLFSKDTLMDGLKLQSYFDTHEIDCIKMVPSHWKALSIDDQFLLPKHTLIFGGDVLPVSYIKDITAQDTGVSIFNHYGPTESTIGKLLHKVDPAFDYVTIPVGTLFSDSEAYVVSSDMSLSPIGVPGELLLGGSGISKGYLNRPDLTKEKFITNPFREGKSQILYKTGDLVSRNALGQIEFLGRVDDQVKIRGYRVELKEISRVIQNYSGVVQSEVLFKEDSLGAKRLVNYLVTEEGYSESDLKSYLLEHLPDYMSPQVYVELEAMPLTSNGKIDRKALPDPTVTEERVYVAPSNEIEEAMVTIWQDLLNAEKIGVTDNFFELGGDSIIVIQVVSRAKKKGYQIKVQDLFDYQTIEELSVAIEQNSKELNTAEQGVLEGEVPLSPIQQWFFDRNEKTVSHFNQAVLLGINKEVDPEHLEKIIDLISKRHDSLRFTYTREVVQQKEEWKQFYGEFTNLYRTETVEEGENIGESITAICVKYQESLDIEKGDLARFVLIKTPDSETHNRLFMVSHHLAVDGVSWRFIIDDLETLLGEETLDETAYLGYKTNSFRDWIHKLKNFAETEEIESQLAYWQQINTDYTPLPTDLSSNKPTRETIKTHEVILSEEYTQCLLKEVNTAYNTEINDLMLSALQMTFEEVFNTQRLALGFEGHGRETIFTDIDLAGTTGWFTNKYPVILSKGDAVAEGDIIKSVKEALRKIPTKGMGYGCLRYLHPSTEIRNSLKDSGWDVVFNYLGQVDNVLSQSEIFTSPSESAGAHISATSLLDEKFVVKAIIVANELRISWDYSKERYHQETVQELADSYIKHLTQLIEHCINKEVSEVTPSDFGLSDALDFKEFDELFESEVQENSEDEGVFRF